MSFNKRFERVIDTLYQSNQYLAAEIIKLGYPSLKDDIPTAQVAWDKNKKKVIFQFNSKFAELLSDEELAFVCAHEAYHVLNGHIFYIHDLLDKAKDKTSKEVHETKIKFNLAADCVVNDSLTNLYELKRFENENIKLIFGKETVGFDCHDLTVADVMKLVPDEQIQKMMGGDESHESWESFFNEDGTINKDFAGKMKNFIQKNMNNSSLSDEEKAKIEGSRKALGRQAGVGKIEDNGRAIDGQSRDRLNWERLLNALIETRSTEDVWNKPNKKMGDLYPDVIIPAWQYKEKETVFIAVDSSSSIDRQALSLFINLVRNTPKHFEVKAITFDTQCYEFNIKNGESPKGGGGTDFSIIEEYIITNLKKYPKAVFVLTDGEGTEVSPKYPKRWAWMLYGSCYDGFCKDMKKFKLAEYVK